MLVVASHAFLSRAQLLKAVSSRAWLLFVFSAARIQCRHCTVAHNRPRFYRNGKPLVKQTTDDVNYDQPMFSRVQSVHGFLPCITVGDKFSVACNFGSNSKAFSKSSKPDDYEWVAQWTAEGGRQAKMLNSESIADKVSEKSSPEDRAREQLERVPERLRKVPLEKGVSQSLRQQLQSLWFPLKKCATRWICLDSKSPAKILLSARRYYVCWRVYMPNHGMRLAKRPRAQ